MYMRIYIYIDVYICLSIHFFILSCPILSYPTLSYPICLSIVFFFPYLILSHLTLSSRIILWLSDLDGSFQITVWSGNPRDTPSTLI